MGEASGQATKPIFYPLFVILPSVADNCTDVDPEGRSFRFLFANPGDFTFCTSLGSLFSLLRRRVGQKVSTGETLRPFPSSSDP